MTSTITVFLETSDIQRLLICAQILGIPSLERPSAAGLASVWLKEALDAKLAGDMQKAEDLYQRDRKARAQVRKEWQKDYCATPLPELP